jgi:hypothetical protein
MKNTTVKVPDSKGPQTDARVQAPAPHLHSATYSSDARRIRTCWWLNRSLTRYADPTPEQQNVILVEPLRFAKPST